MKVSLLGAVAKYVRDDTGLEACFCNNLLKFYYYHSVVTSSSDVLQPEVSSLKL